MSNLNKRAKDIRSQLNSNGYVPSNKVSNLKQRAQGITDYLVSQGYTPTMSVPSSSVSKKSEKDKTIDKSGTSKAFEGARNHISDLVNNAKKTQTSTNKAAPEGIRFDKNKTGFDVEQAKEQAKTAPKKDTKLSGVSNDINSELNRIMDEYKNIQKSKRGPEFNAAVTNLVNENKATLDEYTRQTGRAANLTDIAYQFEKKEKEDWENKLNEGYYKRLKNYYKVAEHADFEQYANGKHNGKKTPYDKVGNAVKNIKFYTGVPQAAVQGNTAVYYKYITDANGENGRIEQVAVASKDKQAVKYLYMTDDEYKIYRYHLNKYGNKSANKFLKDLASVLDRRATEAMSMKYTDIAKENKAVGIISDLAMSLGSGIGSFVDAKVQGIKQNNSTPNEYIPYNPYSDASSAVHKQRASREGVEDGLTGWKRFAADTAFSVGENVARMPLELINPAVGLGLMGVNVAGSTAVEQGLKGETNANRAWNTGALYGAIEIATEKVSLDNIIDIVNAPAKTVKEFARNLTVNLAKQASIEASEEWVAEIADNIADNVINGDKSEYNELIKAYQANGDNGDVATAKAFIEKFVKDPIVSAGSGALSGLVMGAGSSGVAQAVESLSYNDTHTAEQQRIMKEYEAAVDENMGHFLDRVASGENTKYEYRIGKTSDRFNNAIKNGLGIDTDGYTHYLSPDAVKHIENRHGERGKTDTSMSDIKDLQRIGYVIDNYDHVYKTGEVSKKYKDKDNNYAPIVLLTKRVDGHYVVAEAVPDSAKKQVHIISAYKNKALEVQNDLLKSLGITPDNELPDNASNDIVSNSVGAVNNENIFNAEEARNISSENAAVGGSDNETIANNVSAERTPTWQASQLTPSIATYMNGLTGAPSDMSGIETANNTVRSGEYNVFDRDFVNSYADGFVQGMAERNSNAYRTLSSVTDNLARELVSYTLTGQSGLADNQAFRVTAEAFNNVLSDAVNKNAIVHSTSYGNDTRLAQQAAAVRNGDFSVMNIGELQNVDAYTDTDRVHGLIQDEFAEILTENERNAIDSLATAVGRTVKIVPTIGNGKADGCRIGNVLYIAANANDKFTYVFSHELTHSLEDTDGYRNYSSAVLERLAREEGVTIDELVSRKIAEYVEGGITLDDTGARQELVADFTKQMLSDENKAMEFVNSIENAQQRRTVIQWLRDSIRNLINHIRGNFNADVARLNELERISDVFEGMLKEAANDNTVQTDGETQFLFAGKNAKTANVGTLTQAEVLEKENVSAEDIRLQTGWVRGLDGKWRFEIDDSKAEFNRQGFTENPDLLEYRELENKFIQGTITEEENNRLQQLNKIVKGVRKPSTVGDYLKHDELYMAYPDIKDVKVHITGNMDVNGSYKPELDAILLNSNLSNEKMRKTLLHEVQHAIQVREGFAVGADSEMPGYRDTAGEIEARDVSTRADMTAEERQANFPESMRARGDVVSADKAGQYSAETSNGNIQRYTDHEKNNWTNSRYIVVYENDAQLLDFINKSLQKQEGKKIYFGKISQNLATRIFNETGLDVANCNLALKDYEVQKILKNSHGNATEEALRGQSQITRDDLIEIPQIVSEADEIKLSSKLYEGKPVIEFYKDINGQRTLITYFTKKHHDLAVQTMYQGKQKSLSTATDVQASVSTSETTSGTASDIGTSSDGAVSFDAASVNESTPISNDIISENEEIVKQSAKENTGNQIKTDSFKNWFGDWENDPDNASKVVNEDGTPKVVYHGTSEDFTAFDPDMIGANFGQDEVGFFFTDSEKSARNYADTTSYGSQRSKPGNVIGAYLDIKNPLILKTDYDPIDMWDSGYEKYVKQAQSKGNDGIIIKAQKGESLYVAFNPTQIKSATDNIGTFDPNNADIRFAKRNNNDTANNANAAARELVKKYNANGRVYVADVRDAIYALAGEIHDNSYSEETFPKIKSDAEKITKMILDNARIVDESSKEEYDRVSKHIKGTKIKITDELKNSIPDWNDFRKSTMGTLVLANDGTPVDVVYKDLAAEFPQHFDEQEQITQSDQLYHIFDTVRGLKPQESPLSEEEYDIAFEDLTGDIISRAVNIAENYKPRKVKEASQYEDADWNDLAHSDKAWQEWDKQRQEKDRDRQRYNKKLQQIQEKADQRIKRAAEMRKESEARTKLLNIARRLNNMKLSPENKALVPDIVYELDTISKGILEKGYTTEDGREVMGRIDLEDLKERYYLIKETDPDFLPDKDIEAKIGRLDKRQIADMDISDVRELVQTLQQVEHEIRTNNKMLRDAQNREIAQVATSSIGEIRDAKGVKDSTKGSAVDKFWSTQLSPLRFARRLTGWAKNSQFEGLFKAMNDGQLKSTAFKQKASQRFNSLVADTENMQKFTGKKAELIDISAYVPGAIREIYITPAMRTALYLHSKNYSNLKHIQYGGITIPNIEMFNKGRITDAYKSNGMIIRLKPSQVRSITNGMTDFEKKFADAAYQFFNDDCKKAVNETSLALNGYEKAVVKDYFPISSNKNFVNMEFESLMRDGTYEGMGMLKERKYSGNPIVLEDVVKVISRHMNDVADYSGLAVPIRNFNKVYNAIGSKYSYSTKQALNEKWGSNATNYIENLMTDLQGGRTEKGMALLKKLNSNYAQATLSLNVGVTLQQAGSYPTAAAELGWQPLMQAFSEKVTDADKEIITKYTPLLWLRSQGYTTSELGDYSSGTSDDWTKRGKMPWLMGWIQKSDMMTTTKLWKASEFYVRDNFSGLEKGSDDYYKKVAEVYNNVIESTQPNYTPMQRADLLRNPNAIVKATSMFRTQPSQNHNLIYDAFGEYKARKADYEANQSAENKAEMQAAERRLRQTLISQVVAAMVVNLFKGVGLYTKGQLFKHYGGKDEDDEGKLTPQSVITQFLQDCISTMAGNVWFGSDAVGLLFKTLHQHGVGRGAAVFDTEAPALSVYNDIVNDITSIDKMVADGKSNPWTITKKLNKTVVHLGTMFGVPVKNTENLIKGIYKDITDATGSGNIFDLLDAWNEGYNRTYTKSDKSKYKANMTLEEYMDYQAYYEKTLQDMLSGKKKKKDGSKYTEQGAKTQARNEANKKYERLFKKKVE